MRLQSPFLKLPIKFSAERLAEEVRSMPPSAWTPHPTGFPGNEAVRLISPGGRETDDMEGQMAPTRHLLQSPYLLALMGELGAVWGRSRLMGLGPGGEVPRHIDTHYYWRTHLRIHIPVITNPDVHFTCGAETVHMAAGECWLFDSFRWHRVVNGGDQQRVHLVLDTVGGGRLWQLIDAAYRGDAAEEIFDAGAEPSPLAFEKVNAPTVMSPWEMRVHLAFLAEHAEPHPLLSPVMLRLERLVDSWAALWAEHETAQAGWPAYRALLEELKIDLARMGAGALLLRNRLQFLLVLDHVVLVNALDDRVVTRSSEKQPAAVN